MWSLPQGASWEFSLTWSTYPLWYIGLYLRFDARTKYLITESYTRTGIDDAVSWMLDSLASSTIQYRVPNIFTSEKMRQQVVALEEKAPPAVTAQQQSAVMAEVSQVAEQHKAELIAGQEAARVAAEKAQQQRQAELDAERQRAAREAAELLAQEQAKSKAAGDAELKRQEALAAAARKQAALDAERVAQEQSEAERRTKEQAAQSQVVSGGLVAVGGPVTTPRVLTTPIVPTVIDVSGGDDKILTDKANKDEPAVKDVKPPTAPVEPSSGIPLWAIVVAIILFFLAIYFGWNKGD